MRHAVTSGISCETSSNNYDIWNTSPLQGVRRLTSCAPRRLHDWGCGSGRPATRPENCATCFAVPTDTLLYQCLISLSLYIYIYIIDTHTHIHTYAYNIIYIYIYIYTCTHTITTTTVTIKTYSFCQHQRQYYPAAKSADYRLTATKR